MKTMGYFQIVLSLAPSSLTISEVDINSNEVPSSPWLSQSPLLSPQVLSPPPTLNEAALIQSTVIEHRILFREPEPSKQ